MGLIKLECPLCGSHLEFSQDRDVFFCEYCGAKVIKDKQYVELSGKISIDGVATEESLLERAFLYLEDGDYSNADKYLEKALDINPKCSKAYIGKLMAQLHIRNIDILSQWSTPLSNYDLYNKALRFSSDSDKYIYETYNQQIVDKIISKRNKLKKDVDDIENKINPLRLYLIENLKQQRKNKAKKVLWRILLIISFIPIIALTLAGILSNEWGIFIVDAHFVVLSVFLLIKNISIDKIIKEYKKVETELATLEQEKAEREYMYNEWRLNNKLEI